LKISITGRHIEVPKKFALYVRKRFAKWSAFLSHDADVHVVVTVENYRHEVEVTAQDGRYVVNAKQTTKDMFQSIDLLVEKVGRQLVRQHEKIVQRSTASRQAKTIRTREREPRAAAGRELMIDVEPFAGKPMTQEEAAMQLHALRQPFFVFEDIETGQLAVLTKRKDGTFRLIVKE